MTRRSHRQVEGPEALCRAALWLREQYHRRQMLTPAGRSPTWEIGRLCGTLERLRADCRRLDTALDRGWLAAAASQRERCARSLRELEGHIGPALRPLAAPQPPLPAPRELLEELLAVQSEFGELRLSREQGTLEVTTGPIRIEGVDLGEFTIRLRPGDIPEHGPERWFSTVAQDPAPPAGDGSVTHPHVRDDVLCCGDAAAPIRAALEEGRLLDFYLLVRSVLGHYNGQSAYVRLEDWEGRACEDCGGGVTRDEGWYCEGCDREYCGDCIRSCADCGSSGCRSCLRRAEGSGRWLCEGCGAPCAGCGRLMPESELEEEHCPQCLDALAQEEEDDDGQTLDLPSGSQTAGGQTERDQDAQTIQPLTETIAHE